MIIIFCLTNTTFILSSELKYSCFTSQSQFLHAKFLKNLIFYIILRFKTLQLFSLFTSHMMSYMYDSLYNVPVFQR